MLNFKNVIARSDSDEAIYKFEDCRATKNDIVARNDKKRNKRMKKAFTLIELLVAMAVLALMIAFASMVFTVSIDTYRLSMATAEIMQKLRVVTDQLNADFKGLRKDAPLLIQFNLDDPNRYDQVMFFADGDFSSIQLYVSGHPDAANGTTVIRGNIARVFYGQANVNTHDPGNEPADPRGPKERRRILARRQHILTSDTNVDDWPGTNVVNFTVAGNESYEHDRLSLADWKIITSNDFDNRVIPDCFGSRPRINTNADYHKLFCEGIGSFSIQWAYWDTASNRFVWYPDGANLAAGGDEFGVYFNVDALSTANWNSIGSVSAQYRENETNFFPSAIKFTFTLYDSKSVIRDGMVFSHIVYLGQ